jgi:hypothetical protein
VALAPVRGGLSAANSLSDPHASGFCNQIQNGLVVIGGIMNATRVKLLQSALANSCEFRSV